MIWQLTDPVRARARQLGLPVMDYILRRIRELEQETGIRRTIFAACPNSVSVIRAAIRSAKRWNAPIKFAATLNQVDLGGGYTGMTPQEFVRCIQEECSAVNFNGPVIIAVDHGGPWLKDAHRAGNFSYEQTMTAVRKSLEAAALAGYDLLHIDPTVDISGNLGIEIVVARTVELISAVESLRIKNDLPPIAYEVGTEEVHGGLADMTTFRRFLEQLKLELAGHNLKKIWPCFVVGKVGTDLHTTLFDAQMARQLTQEAAKYGSLIKGHYTDNVDNPADYPASGMGAANVGPEFTEAEYDGLMECAVLEEQFFEKGQISKLSLMKKTLWQAVIQSNRWQKWLQTGEKEKSFEALTEQRQAWLIKTGCRYIWAAPEIVAARQRLTDNLQRNGIWAEEIVLTAIERRMDKYFNNFNLTGLNRLL